MLSAALPRGTARRRVKQNDDDDGRSPLTPRRFVSRIDISETSIAALNG
jgi:hypothetical protein